LLSSAISDGFGQVTLMDLNSHPGEAWIDDRPLAIAIRDELEKYPLIVTWYGKMFDVPVLNGRLSFWGERLYQPKLHVDLYFYSGGQFVKIGGRSLDSVSEFYNSPNRKTKLSTQIWDRADHGDKAAYDLIREHNIADVLVLRDVWPHLSRLIANIHA